MAFGLRPVRSRSSSLSTPPESVDEEEQEGEGEDVDHLIGGTGCARKPSRRERIRSLRQKTKSKAKKLLNLGSPNSHEADDDGYGQLEPDLEDDPAFNPTQLDRMANPVSQRASEQKMGPLHRVLKTVSHPKDAIKSAATKTTAGILSTVVDFHTSERADFTFLQTHCDVARGDDANDFPDPSSDGYLNTTRKLESHRESIRVAWITSAHVDRVRVVPRRQMKCPELSAYKKYNEDGVCVGYEWRKWLGAVRDEMFYPNIVLILDIDDSPR